MSKSHFAFLIFTLAKIGVKNCTNICEALETYKMYEKMLHDLCYINNTISYNMYVYICKKLLTYVHTFIN